jgi:hypothetical protein
MLAADIPIGAGTDATRVASYDPWVALYWLTTGKTLGGLALYGDSNILGREEALRLWTHGSAWFSGEADVKGRLAPGMYADLAVLSADYMSVSDEEIRRINSVLTIVGGKPVHGEGDFVEWAPPLPPASPDWSPVNTDVTPGYRAELDTSRFASSCHAGCSNYCGLHGHDHGIAWTTPLPVSDEKTFWGALGCSCFAV